MENSQKPKILIIVGTTRQNRFSEKAAAYVLQEANKIQDAQFELVDLRDYPLPFFDEPLPPSMFEMMKHEYKNEAAKKWTNKIAEADGFIIVTAEYNHGYPAVLKNAIDYVSKEWNRKPVGFVSYGSALGSRAIEQLRLVAIELQMAPIRHAIHIPMDIFMAAMMGKGPQGNEVFEPMRKGPSGDPVERFFDDLLWWTRALKAARMNNA